MRRFQLLERFLEASTDLASLRPGSGDPRDFVVRWRRLVLLQQEALAAYRKHRSAHGC